MTEFVLDASVVLKWFAPKKEAHAAQAHRLRDRYQAGEMIVTVPSLLSLELINVAGRRWQWREQELLELAVSTDALGFDVVDPALDGVAAWTARGLTAYDAAYVALAESGGIPLITDDDRILEIASGVAHALAAVH